MHYFDVKGDCYIEKGRLSLQTIVVLMSSKVNSADNSQTKIFFSFNGLISFMNENVRKIHHSIFHTYFFGIFDLV